jgi:hypothetical protein
MRVGAGGCSVIINTEMTTWQLRLLARCQQPLFFFYQHALSMARPCVLLFAFVEFCSSQMILAKTADGVFVLKQLI